MDKNHKHPQRPLSIDNVHHRHAGGILSVQGPGQLLLCLQPEGGDVAEHQALAVVLLVQQRQHQILQVRGCLGAGDQMCIRDSSSCARRSS